MRQVTSIPEPPPEPFACYIAKGFRTLMQSEGLDDSILPEDFSRRLLTDYDCIPSETWRHFATKPRLAQGQCVYNLIHLIWTHYIGNMAVFPPGSEFIVAPPDMLGIDWFQRMITELDYLCLPKLGLDGCRSINFHNQVTYPEVEEVRNRNRRNTVGRYGLYNSEQIERWVGRFDELYGPYQPSITNNLAIPKVIEIIAQQLYHINIDLF